MAQSPFKTTASATTTFSTITAVSLVVFALGLFGLIVLNAQAITNHFKESVQVQVFFNDESDESEVARVKKKLETRPFTKSARIIKREEAAMEMERELGEEFVDFLGFYPIPNSIDLSVESEYANNDSLVWIEKEILTESAVREVVYQKVLLEKINRFMSRAGVALLMFSVLLLIVALALINNTIRLAVFSKRFLIKSMQLVGATPGFIRWPFVRSGMWQGLLAGLIAVTLLVPVLYFAQNALPELAEIQKPLALAGLAFGMLIFAMLFSGISTFLAITLYLRLRQEQLY